MRALLKRLDEWTQRHGWLAFPIAVWKKFGDDDASKLAALVAYYSFFGIFPLLLVLVTVLASRSRETKTCKSVCSIPPWVSCRSSAAS